MQTGLECVAVPLSIVRMGNEVLEKYIGEILNGDSKILIADAETDDDLKIIANASIKYKDRILYSGSAGFAEQLPEVLDICHRKRLLIVAGSVTEITRRQMNAVKEAFAVREFNPKIERLLGGTDDEALEMKRLLEYFREATEDIWLVWSARTVKDVEEAQNLGNDFGLDFYDIRERIASFLGHSAAELLKIQPVDMLLLTGGDTAFKVFESFSAEGLLIKGEAMSGIPWGIMEKGGEGIIRVMTKGGGIGEPEEIVDLMASWRGILEEK